MDDYYKDSVVERMYCNHLVDELRKKYDVKFYSTPAEGKDKYEGFIYIFDKGDYILRKRIMIECKVRSESHPDWMLERVKHSNLKALRNKFDKQAEKETGNVIHTYIWYLCVTPKGTFLWNLKEDYEWEQKWCPISTRNLSLGYKDKDVYLLKEEDAKKFDWTNKLFKFDDENEKVIKKSDLNQKRIRCIFEGKLI